MKKGTEEPPKKPPKKEPASSNSRLLPKKLRLELSRRAKKDCQEHRALFEALPHARDVIAGYYRSLLPRAQPGAKRRQLTTDADQLHRQTRKKHQDWSATKVWAHVYKTIIPGYAKMTQLQRRDAQHTLKTSVKERRKYDKKKVRMKQNNLPPENSTT